MPGRPVPPSRHNHSGPWGRAVLCTARGYANLELALQATPTMTPNRSEHRGSEEAGELFMDITAWVVVARAEPGESRRRRPRHRPPLGHSHR